MSRFEVGDQVGPYRIDGVVGVGGMGRVLSAYDTRLNRRVAIKVVIGHGAHSPAYQARLAREAAILARLDHPHVILIFDHGEHDGVPYLVTPLASGGDLARFLAENGSLPIAHTVRLCRQVAEALDAAHRVGVVHRDVKPANVLFRDERTDHLHVYLGDFGVARTEASGLTTAGALAGTWNYLAPELTEGGTATPSSDIYAVGCLLWECLTGRPPYLGSDVEVALQHQQAPVPRLPDSDAYTRSVNQILQRCLAKDPDERYRSAAELADALQEVERTLPSAAGVPGFRARRRIRVAGAAAVAVAALVGAGILWWPSGDDEPPAGATPSGPPGPTVVRGDLDGDGFGDVAITQGQNGSFLFTSDGSGFAAAPVPVQRWRPVALTGDIDGDGAPDVVTVNDNDGLVTVRSDLGDGFGPATLVRATEDTVAIVRSLLGDVDGDGKDDVVTVATGSAGEADSVRVALGRGDSTFAPAAEWSAAPLSYGDKAIGDLDGDGRADLVSLRNGPAEAQQEISVLLSTGDGFAEPTTQAVPRRLPDLIRLGDVDGDGVLELVGFPEEGPAVEVLRFDAATMTWADPERWYAPAEGLAFYGGVLSDVDGDGLDDLVGFSGPDGGRITTLRSTGSAFEPAPSFAANLDLPDDNRVELVAREPGF